MLFPVGLKFHMHCAGHTKLLVVELIKKINSYVDIKFLMYICVLETNIKHLNGYVLLSLNLFVKHGSLVN